MAPGDLVVVPWSINCGTCDNCRAGLPRTARPYRTWPCTARRSAATENGLSRGDLPTAVAQFLPGNAFGNVPALLGPRPERLAPRSAAVGVPVKVPSAVHDCVPGKWTPGCCCDLTAGRPGSRMPTRGVPGATADAAASAGGGSRDGSIRRASETRRNAVAADPGSQDRPRRGVRQGKAAGAGFLSGRQRTAMNPPKGAVSTVNLSPCGVVWRRVGSVAEESAKSRSVAGVRMPRSRRSTVSCRAWPVGGA